MKESKYMQCILCEGETFQEAVDKFNLEMKRHAVFNPTFERAGDKFLIYIKIHDLAPETIAEAKQMEGKTHTCADCCWCERPMTRFGTVDKRKMKAVCVAGDDPKKIRVDERACDIFYLEHQDEIRREAK